MAKIYVSNSSRADAKVFMTDRDYQADLLFCEVDKEYQAKGDALWCFVDKSHQADFTICWVDKEYQADLKVFKVSQSYKAKWKESHKLRGRIGD